MTAPVRKKVRVVRKKVRARVAQKKEATARVPAETSQLTARIPKSTMRAFRLRCLQQGVTAKATIERMVNEFIARG